MSHGKLTEDQVAAHRVTLPEWQLEGGKLLRKFRFRDFVEAFAFMTKVAMQAEKLDHHPDWQNVYDTVVIRLSTHDVGGLSAADFELARRIDTLAASR